MYFDKKKKIIILFSFNAKPKNLIWDNTKNFFSVLAKYQNLLCIFKKVKFIL